MIRFDIGVDRRQRHQRGSRRSARSCRASTSTCRRPTARRHDHLRPPAARDDAPQVINTPNWSSQAGHGMTVTFRDWVQDINTWGRASEQAEPLPRSDRTAVARGGAHRLADATRYAPADDRAQGVGPAGATGARALTPRGLRTRLLVAPTEVFGETRSTRSA